MKILVFGVTNWHSQHQADYLKKSLEEWRNRVRYFCGDPELFISTGTYSDPAFSPLNVELVQNGIPKTFPYSKNWNYFRNGFITGLWHSILNKKFDVLVHVQCRTFLGIDLIQPLHRFMDSSKQIMAPRYVSKTRGIDNSVEVGMMAMKPDAVRIFTTFSNRPSFSQREQPNCETEAYNLFEKEWYNPFPEINSCRKRESGIGKDSVDDLTMEEFMKLPLIAAQKHADENDIIAWCAAHPYGSKGGY